MPAYLSIPGAEADADFSAHQYHAVQLSATENRVSLITNANAQRPIGILQDDPNAAGQGADIAYMGIAKAECGGTVTRGNPLGVNNDGEVIADVEVLDGTAVDLHHIGFALEDGVDGDIIKVLVHTPTIVGLE